MSKPNPFDSQALVQFQKIEGSKVPATSSIQIAQTFEKEHKDVLEKINEQVLSGDFSERNFTLTSYKDIQGKRRPLYLLDKKFATFIILSFTGEKAKEWKLKYIDEFERMSLIVKREKGDTSAELNKTVNMILEYKRKMQGFVTESNDYAKLASAINVDVFGEKGTGKQLRQQMTPEQQIKLNQTLSAAAKEILDNE